MNQGMHSFRPGQRAQRSVVALINSATVVGNLQAVVSLSNAATALSGSLTANTLATALRVNAPGRINFLAIGAGDTTSRTLRLRLTLDGNVVYDKTSAALTVAGSGIVAVGRYVSGTAGYQPLDFQASMLIEFASSLTENNLATLYWNYEVWA